ncbi:hypothetical protein HHI36_001242 [Cryptolaemus montrouzieri]|uniref:Uncharacterized protein n=1 Tax=Cryptolaemus montrouzieri TaxID=559131 RepID=A0ABD2P7F4_9CUCU
MALGERRLQKLQRRYQISSISIITSEADLANILDEQWENKIFTNTELKVGELEDDDNNNVHVRLIPLGDEEGAECHKKHYPELNSMKGDICILEERNREDDGSVLPWGPDPILIYSTKGGTTHKKGKTRFSYAFVIEKNSGSYGESLREVKVALGKERVNEGIRTTRGGNLLITTDKEE